MTKTKNNTEHLMETSMQPLIQDKGEPEVTF